MKILHYASYLILLSAVFTLSLSFSFAADSTYVCGVTLSDNISGYGGVVMCGVAYGCGGESDGVCPERYSSGGTETNDNKTRLYTRYSEVADISYDFDLVVHDNGTAACASVAGDCVELERYDSGSWSTLAGEDCNSDTSSLSGEVRAVCENVPQTASCYNCPDPDCTTDFNFVVYDEDEADDKKGIDGATVSFSSVHETFTGTGNTNENGTVTFEGATGIFNYSCSAVGYEIYSGQHYMQHNSNSLNCPLTCKPSIQNDDDVDEYYSMDDENRPTPDEYSCVVPSPDDTKLVCSANCVSEDCDEIPDECIGAEAGTTQLIGTNSDGELVYRQCCNRPDLLIEGKEFEVNPASSDVEVKNLLTRSYRKQINERPVTLKIISYEVE